MSAPRGLTLAQTPMLVPKSDVEAARHH